MSSSPAPSPAAWSFHNPAPATCSEFPLSTHVCCLRTALGSIHSHLFALQRLPLTPRPSHSAPMCCKSVLKFPQSSYKTTVYGFISLSSYYLPFYHLSIFARTPFLKRFYLFREGKRGRQRGREAWMCERYINRLPLAQPLLGTWPAT